jgi:hypothetical protein
MECRSSGRNSLGGRSPLIHPTLIGLFRILCHWIRHISLLLYPSQLTHIATRFHGQSLKPNISYQMDDEAQKPSSPRSANRRVIIDSFSSSSLSQLTALQSADFERYAQTWASQFLTAAVRLAPLFSNPSICCSDLNANAELED